MSEGGHPHSVAEGGAASHPFQPGWPVLGPSIQLNPDGESSNLDGQSVSLVPRPPDWRNSEDLLLLGCADIVSQAGHPLVPSFVCGHRSQASPDPCACPPARYFPASLKRSSRSVTYQEPAGLLATLRSVWPLARGLPPPLSIPMIPSHPVFPGLVYEQELPEGRAILPGLLRLAALTYSG